MSVNNEILCEELWRGKVPIELILDPSAVVAHMPPDPVFMLASRYSYLPSIAFEIIEAFRLYAIDLNSTVWFEAISSTNEDDLNLDAILPHNSSQGNFLRVNLPVGVLFDLFGPQSNVVSHKPIVPWRIMVHFSNFPAEELIKCESDEFSSKLFAHSLKQALFLVHGSTRKYNELVIEKRQAIWTATKLGSYGDFSPIASELIAEPADTRIIPVRIVSNCWNSTLQRPFVVTDNSGQPSTMQIVISIIEHHVNALNKAKYADEDGKISKQGDSEITPVATGSISIVVQGIQIPATAGLYDVWRTFCHADLFLYVCAIVN
jgi:hypothetical protein